MSTQITVKDKVAEKRALLNKVLDINTLQEFLDVFGTDGVGKEDFITNNATIVLSIYHFLKERTNIENEYLDDALHMYVNDENFILCNTCEWTYVAQEFIGIKDTPYSFSKAMKTHNLKNYAGITHFLADHPNLNTQQKFIAIASNSELDYAQICLALSLRSQHTNDSIEYEKYSKDVSEQYHQLTKIMQMLIDNIDAIEGFIDRISNEYLLQL